jgi:hypothetical protein
MNPPQESPQAQQMATTAEMELLIQPSSILLPSVRQENRKDKHNDQCQIIQTSRQRNARVWCATLRAPAGCNLDSAFFKGFPQKHQVVAGLERGHKQGWLLIAAISNDLHSLGTVIRKVQNAIIAQSYETMEDIRFEMLEEQIGQLLTKYSGSFQLTTTRLAYEEMFHNTLVPSLYGVRWLKDLFQLLCDTVYLAPLDDDQLVCSATEFKDNDCTLPRRRLASHVSRLMHLKVVPSAEVSRLKELCVSFVQPLFAQVHSKFLDEPWFDIEIGQLLVVLDSLEQLTTFFRAVERALSECTSLERSPVAFLDGIARNILKEFVANANEEILVVAPQTYTVHNVTSPTLITNKVMSDEVKEGLEPTNLSPSARVIMKPKVMEIHSREDAQASKICGSTWFSSLCSMPSLLRDSTPQVSVEDSDQQYDFSLFTSASFCTGTTSSATAGQSVVVDTSTPAPSSSMHISSLNDSTNSVLNETALLLPQLPNLLSMVSLGLDTAKELRAADVQDTEALLTFKDDALESLGIKRGPLLRLRALIRAVHTSCAKLIQV